MNETVEKITYHRDYAGAKLGMWLFLLTELGLFFGPLLLYVMHAIRHPEAFHAAAMGLDKNIGLINTLILLTSSLTAALSVASIRRGKGELTLIFIFVTVALGGIFLVNKYFEWMGKIAHGIYPGGEAFAALPPGEAVFYGLYFFATGLHGLHVIAGMLALAIAAAFTATGTVNKRDFVKLENAALYWHLVDVIWIFLFPFFYLIS
ncbi:MAG: cytochrome C oxidase subunit III [Deltaproteobacteria bacterium GWB2_55_19]|nr:MAG: cytochrome C oxidase subunit III [Deltaproteobacteria bacterium GWB2_55_19]HAO92296.1 cytochrome C oxidase subunit III [Deltaproteobacteria bacterium]